MRIKQMYDRTNRCATYGSTEGGWVCGDLTVYGLWESSGLQSVTAPAEGPFEVVERVDREDLPDDLHVVPEFEGEREHDDSVNCWCRPSREDGCARLVVHERRAEA